MKRYFAFLLFVVISMNISAQENANTHMFSSLSYGMNAGINFNTIPTIGGSVLAEIKTPLTSSINLYMSTGYTEIYDNKDYTVKSYVVVNIDNETTYQTKLLKVDKVIYSVIPVYLGAEYSPINGKYSPFVTCKVGYNFSSAIAEGASYIGASGIVNIYDELPAEYKNKAPRLGDGSSFCAAIGIGMKYSLTSKINLSLSYVYQYNDSIVNTNQIMLGISF
jgi:opacity protein-like surface antigen